MVCTLISRILFKTTDHILDKTEGHRAKGETKEKDRLAARDRDTCNHLNEAIGWFDFTKPIITESK